MPLCATAFINAPQWIDQSTLSQVETCMYVGIWFDLICSSSLPHNDLLKLNSSQLHQCGSIILLCCMHALKRLYRLIAYVQHYELGTLFQS